MTEAIPTKVQCCIAGGGPAGMMLGFLLARAGIEVAVLEKWPDFFRDFRGDTIHPSTMELLKELGLLETFLQLPHQTSPQLAGMFHGQEIVLADFSHLNVTAPYIAFMPQWDFLNFIASQATAYPNFHLLMETEVTDLVHAKGRVCGVQVLHNGRSETITADLVVGADGRHSVVRKKTNLKNITTNTPIDVLWFPVPRKKTDPSFSLGYMEAGQFMVMLERDSYWQCGYVIPKGAFEDMQQGPISKFHESLQALVPLDDDRFRFVTQWDDIRLLSVTVDYLSVWHKPGVLCIGDAAHAMSPIGGVGINLAIQDAVAAARILAPKLSGGAISEDTLAAIQKRRMFPARVVQRIQVLLQNRVILPILHAEKLTRPALPFRLLQAFPVLRRVTAHLIGIGIRPEHITK